MLPPGLSFNAISEKALAASRAARLPRAYWAWEHMLAPQRNRVLPVHAGDEPAVRPARSARHARARKGCEQVFARHRRLAEAARAAVRAWELEIACERADECSPVVTTVMMPGPAARRRPVPRDRARALQHVARRRPRPAEGTGVPHRPPGGLQRSDADGHAVRRRDGPGARGVPFERGRRRRRADALCAGLREPVANAGVSRAGELGGLRFARNAATPSRKSCAGVAGRDEIVDRRRRRAAGASAMRRMRFLRGADGQRRVARQSSRPGRARRRRSSCGSAMPRDQAERRPPRSASSSRPVKSSILGPRRPEEIDEPRAVRGRQAVAERAGDRDAELCGRRAHAQIAGQRDRAAAAGGDALHLRDGRRRSRARADR